MFGGTQALGSSERGVEKAKFSWRKSPFQDVQREPLLPSACEESDHHRVFSDYHIV